ncbi:hypothetical protein PR001_g19069 [Phytophthora rubi]|uniref:Uncharacterized protein n=1 Tax=Phytophthora rubi TaxID=129364 RepID=A0A6A3JVK5_9STRA|nr:hypothetical protein PR002_g19518 [Phytophthora rubi]KAE8999390.1 hypothetical protein PR001_g19069 [Phytophthora rubi]
MEETQPLADAPPAVDVKAEAEPEPQLEAAASPTDADAAKSKKKKKNNNNKSRRKSLERTQSELEEDAPQEPEQDEKEEEKKEEKEEKEPSIEEAEPSVEEKTVEEDDNQADHELAPPELERTSSLDSMKATGTRAVGSLFSRFKVGRKKPLPSRTESAAKLELVSPSPVKTAVKRLEVQEETSLDDLPMRTKRDFFADGEQSVHVSAERDKYDALERQRTAEKEAARLSPPSSTRASEQVQVQDEASEGEAAVGAKEQADVTSETLTSQSLGAVENQEPLAAGVKEHEDPAADSLLSSEEMPVSLDKVDKAEEESTEEVLAPNQVPFEVTIAEAATTEVDVTDATEMPATVAKLQEDAEVTAADEPQPVSLELELDLEPAGQTVEAKVDQEEVAAPPSTDLQDTASDVAKDAQIEETELLQVKIAPPTSELPSETTEAAKPERMSPVKSLASRFEGKREQSLDNLKFRTVREFFSEERSIRVGAEKQKYEAQAQQQKLKAKAEEEAKSKYKIGSSFKSPGKDGVSPAASPELRATTAKESGVAVEHFNISTPDAAVNRKKFSFDEGHVASDSPGKSSEGAPEALTPVKSIASRFEGKREQSLDNLKFRTVREFFPEERSVRVGSEKQKFEAQAKQDKSLDNLKFRTVREFFPDDGKRSIHVGAEKAKFEALTKQQGEAAKAAEHVKLKHAAPSPNPTSTNLKSSEESPSARNDVGSSPVLEDKQVDAGVDSSVPKDSATVEPPEENADTDVELDSSLHAIAANQPLDSLDISLAKAEDKGDYLSGPCSDGLTVDQKDYQADISPVTDVQDQGEDVTNTGNADDENDANMESTDVEVDQPDENRTSVDEATIEQEVKKEVPSAELGPAELVLIEPVQSEENQTPINGTTLVPELEKNIPTIDNEAAELDVGESVKSEDNQALADEATTEQEVENEVDASAELDVGDLAQPEAKHALVDEANFEHEIVKEVPSTASNSSELYLGGSLQPEENEILVDETVVEHEVEKDAPSADNGSVTLDIGENEWNETAVVHEVEIDMPRACNETNLDHGESVVDDAELAGKDNTDAVNGTTNLSETVKAVGEQVNNAQVELDVVGHAGAVEAEASATRTNEKPASPDVEANTIQKSGEVVEQVDPSDGLVELDLNEPELGQQVDQPVAPVEDDIQYSAKTNEPEMGQQVDQPVAPIDDGIQYSAKTQEVVQERQPDIAKDAVGAENELEESEQKSKSKSRPMLTTERLFVVGVDAIETEDTVVVGERPTTDGEDEFEPQSSIKAPELITGVTTSETKLGVSSTSKSVANTSKTSPKLTRKVSAGSVGSSTSSSARTTVPVPMKRASITAPTASYMAKKAAEAEELHKASQRLKKQGSASKLNGTVSETGFIKPPSAAPTVPVPMKRTSITAPTASYMARKAAEAEKAHRASPTPKQTRPASKQKTTAGSTGFKPPAAATTTPVPMKRASITAPTASWQARNVPEASESHSTAKIQSTKSKGAFGPTVPVAPKRASIMAPTASYIAKKAVEQADDVNVAESSIPSRNKRYSNVKSKVMQGIQSGSMHVATHKTITKEEFIAAERRKSLGSAGVRSVLDSFDRRASLTARVTIDNPPEPFMRSALSRKKLNSTVPRYLNYENAPGYAERAQKQYERRKRLEEENAAKSERRQKELRVFFSERQQKALKLSAEEVRRGLEAHEFSRLAKESELEVQKTLRKEKQRERSGRTHTRGSSTTSSVGASSSNGVPSRPSKKSSVSSVEEKIVAVLAVESAAPDSDTAVEVAASAEEIIVEKDALPAEEPVAAFEASVEELIATDVQVVLAEAAEVEKQTTAVPAVDIDLTLEHVAKKIDFDEASSDSDEKDTSNV